jgi:hypothetical protein
LLRPKHLGRHKLGQNLVVALAIALQGYRPAPLGFAQALRRLPHEKDKAPTEFLRFGENILVELEGSAWKQRLLYGNSERAT